MRLIDLTLSSLRGLAFKLGGDVVHSFEQVGCRSIVMARPRWLLWKLATSVDVEST